MEGVCTAAHLFGILNNAPHPLQPPSRNSMTARAECDRWRSFQAKRGGGVTLPLPARRRFWFGNAAPGPVPRLRGQACLPSEKRGPPFRPPHFVSSPPWQQMPHGCSRSLQPARRRWRAPARVTGAHVRVTHREGSPSRQAGSLPSSPVPPYQEAERNSSFARALCRLKREAVRSN